MESELLNATSKCLIEISEDEVLCINVFEQREMEREQEIHISTLLFIPTSLCPYIYQTTSQTEKAEMKDGKKH